MRAISYCDMRRLAMLLHAIQQQGDKKEKAENPQIRFFFFRVLVSPAKVAMGGGRTKKQRRRG